MMNRKILTLSLLLLPAFLFSESLFHLQVNTSAIYGSLHKPSFNGIELDALHQFTSGSVRLGTGANLGFTGLGPHVQGTLGIGIPVELKNGTSLTPHFHFISGAIAGYWSPVYFVGGKSMLSYSFPGTSKWRLTFSAGVQYRHLLGYPPEHDFTDVPVGVGVGIGNRVSFR